MGILRRILGGGTKEDGTKEDAGPDGSSAAPEPVAFDETERDRELLQAEARRLDDDLIQRQLRYADRAWTPPAQGGTMRAEDADRPADQDRRVPLPNP
ncbi:MAG: hypothetical protein ACYC65_15255 [Candidatus Limnocylindrales bacterium]